MATRRISTACLARNLGSLPRARPQLTPLRFQNVRQLRITPIYYEQKANVGVKRDSATEVTRGGSKVYKNADQAVADLENGSVILSAGFGLCGTAGTFNTPFV
jgi:3-oxoacid CoA-transferase